MTQKKTYRTRKKEKNKQEILDFIKENGKVPYAHAKSHHEVKLNKRFYSYVNAKSPVFCGQFVRSLVGLFRELKPKMNRNNRFKNQVYGDETICPGCGSKTVHHAILCIKCEVRSNKD